MHNACDVIAFVDVAIEPLGHLPVLGVAAGDDDLDDDLVVVGDWDGRLDFLRLGAGMDDYFEHGGFGVLSTPMDVWRKLKRLWRYRRVTPAANQEIQRVIQTMQLIMY